MYYVKSYTVCDSINWHLNVKEHSSYETCLKESFFAVLGDVLDLDFSFGASGANNFSWLWLQFFLWFRTIFSRVPTHLTTGQLKILPLPWKNRRLAGAKHNRNSVTAGPALLEYTATPLTSSLLPLSCLYICCNWTALPHSGRKLF